MLRKSLKFIGLTLSLCLATASAWAEIDGPDMYVYVEVSVQEATIEGMRQRLTLLQSTEYSTDMDAALDAQTQVVVADVYQLFATTAAAHTAYGTRHAEDIAAWLDANPQWKDRLAGLATQFRLLSDQLTAARRTS